MSFDHVTKILDGSMATYGVRCYDCIVTKDHEVVYRHMNGTADVAGTALLTGDNYHDIFSASKVLTIIAVMQMVEQGKIDLDAPLSAYLPAFREMYVADDFDLTDFVKNYKFIFGWPTGPKHLAKNPVIIRDMLSMKAGFSYNIASPEVLALLKEDPDPTTQQIVNAWAKSTLLYEPGTRYAYSYALDIMAAVVEVVSGMRFADYMKKYVFEPVGAKEIYYHLPEDKVPMLTELYATDPVTKKLVPTKVNAARFSKNYDAGGAGICTRVEAYSRVLDTLANDGVAANGARILTKESIDEIRKNRLNEQQMEDFHVSGQKLEYGYGYGVRTLVNPMLSKSPVGEFGWDGAAGAYVLADPENHLTIFYVQAAPDSNAAFYRVHPMLRDAVYAAL